MSKLIPIGILVTLVNALILIGTLSTVNAAELLNATSAEDNNDGIYACNVARDTDKFCKENLAKNIKKEQESHKSSPEGIYACNVITDTDEFCKRNLDKNSNPNSEKHHTSHITVSFGDLGGYTGKGKIVIKNEDTGKTLVTHDLNFAKQRANQGDNCCVKTYAFDRVGTNTHKGDTILAKVFGGGGSWESGAYKWKANLHMSVDLDEIGQ